MFCDPRLRRILDMNKLCPGGFAPALMTAMWCNWCSGFLFIIIISTYVK